MRVSGLMLNAFLRNERGNIAVLFSLALMPLLIAGGAAIDYSMAVGAKSELQGRLDAAVLSGVQQAAGAQVAKAEQVFDANTAGFKRIESRTFSATGSVLTGEAHGSIPTSLLSIVGIHAIPITVTSAAERQTSPVCILVKDTAANALYVNSGVTVTAPDCEIHARSSAWIDSGQNIRSKRMCLDGRRNGNNAAPANLEEECDAIADPYANKLPGVSVPTNTCATKNGGNYDGKNNDLVLSGGDYCSFNFNGTHASVTFTGPANVKNVVFSGITTLNLRPGLYENITFNSGIKTVNLAPGLYIWKSATNLDSAKLAGEGVTIYFPDSSSHLRSNAGGSYDLKAPVSGTYAGILFFEKDGLGTSSYTMDGASPNNFEGLIYLPSRNITFNANSNIRAGAFTLVVNRMLWNGGMNWTLSPGPKAMSSGGSGGGSARLVN